MPWRPDWSAFDRDPSLDIFRDSVAEVSDDSTTGIVVFRVAPRWVSRGGFFTKWGPGVEGVEFLKCLWPNAADAPDPDKSVRETGWTDSSSQWLDELRNGSYGIYESRGDAEAPEQERMLRVRWLEGTERVRAMHEWGFEAG